MLVVHKEISQLGSVRIHHLSQFFFWQCVTVAHESKVEHFGEVVSKFWNLLPPVGDLLEDRAQVESFGFLDQLSDQAFISLINDSSLGLFLQCQDVGNGDSASLTPGDPKVQQPC